MESTDEAVVEDAVVEETTVRVNTPPPNKKKHGCGFGCLITFLIILAGLVILGAFSKQLKERFPDLFESNPQGSAGEDEFPDFEEVWSAGEGDVNVVRIPITGMIMLGENSPWMINTTEFALRAIRRATLDEDISGILLEVDSGGGGVTASDIIYHALKQFKAAKEGRVVVAIMGDTAASGAYYISLAADYIIAHPTTITGSIGVIMQSYNVSQLAQKLGVSDVTVRSGENKDLLNAFQPVSNAHKEIIQETVNAMYERFAGLVAENRKLPLSKVKQLADGRIFTSEQAKANGLIDEIGYIEDAYSKLAELLDEKSVCIYRYQERENFLNFLKRPKYGLSTELQNLLKERGPQLQYRWNPGL